MIIMKYSSAIYFVSFLTSAVTASWSGCAPLGPLLPRPSDLSNSSTLLHATSSFEATLQSAVHGSVRSGFSVENTTFSLGLVSLDSAEPIWTYHHRGSANMNGTDTIDNDTQYLIGSISKIITDLLVLRTGIDLDTPITQYLPSLANDTSLVKWKDITLAALADHLSGIPPNYGFSDFYFLQPILEGSGFPVVMTEDYAVCGVTGLNGACSQEELLPALLSAHPIAQPNTRPAYSQLSFTLLSYALSAKLNKTYPELLNEYIFQPFNLTNSGASPGNSSVAAIPPVDNSWGANYGDNAPGGGLYSSLTDLSRISHSVLTRKSLSSEAAVRNWLHPHSTTSSPYSLVGRPWEMYHARNLTNSSQTTLIHGKNGGAYGYTAQFSLIDHLGIGMIVLTAGPPDAWTKLYDAMLSVFVPAVHEESIVQADRNGYVGNFSSSDGLVRMSTSLAPDGVGIKLDSLTRNGSDILAGIQTLSSTALPQFGNLLADWRMFPSDIIATNSTSGVVKQDWRINFEFAPNTVETAGSDLPGQGARRDECKAWQTSDWMYYGGEAVDRIVFVRDGRWRVKGVEVPFLRAVLERV